MCDLKYGGLFVVDKPNPIDHLDENNIMKIFNPGRMERQSNEIQHIPTLPSKLIKRKKF